MKKIVFGIFVMFIMVMHTHALELNSKYAVLYNLNEDKVIYEKNKDEKVSIASLTKIMTALVAIDNIKDFDEKVTITSDMLRFLDEYNAYVIGLKVNQKVTYNDLLYGTLLPSGADCARALAVSIAGSEEEFVKMMNDKAKELGLDNTYYQNSIGLDQNRHYSTTDEVAKLLIEALKNKKFKEVFTTKSYVLSDKSMTLYSSLVSNAKTYGLDINYFEGAKTGYTLDAGKCLASVALDSENNIEYLLVTIYAPIDSSRAYNIEDAINTYDYYFENYKYHNLVDKGDLILTLPTKYGKESEVNIYASEDIKYYLDNTFNKEDVTLDYNGVDIVKTGMNAGDKLGTIDVIYNGEVLKTFDVLLTEKVDFSLGVFLKENIVVVLISLALIALLVYFRIKIIKNRRRKKRRK